MMKRPDTGQNIALSVTIVVALLLLILLMGTHLDLPVRQSDKESEYITMIPDDSEVVEELFIEPVLRWILPEVRLRQKTVVKVTVMVRADGSVESATCQPGSADASLMEACRKASLKTRWTPKTGASLARGVITWTLVPRQ